jgi:hypothetical protein
MKDSNTKKLFDIKLNKKNPLLDIDNCKFDLTLESCINETCSICSSVCTSVNVHNNNELSKFDKNVLSEIKIQSNILNLLFKFYPVKVVNITFKFNFLE